MSSAEYGNADFQPGQQEVEAVAPAPVTGIVGIATAPAAKEAAATSSETASVAEGLSILQKVLFLVVITACIAAFLRMNKSKENDAQKYSKVAA